MTLSSSFPVDSGKASNHPLKQKVFKSSTKRFPRVPSTQRVSHEAAVACLVFAHLLPPLTITDQCVPLQIPELASDFNSSSRHSPAGSQLLYLGCLHLRRIHTGAWSRYDVREYHRSAGRKAVCEGKISVFTLLVCCPCRA